VKAGSKRWAVIPAVERVKKSKWRRNSPLVMAVLDTAIQEKPRYFNVILDGRVSARPWQKSAISIFFARSKAGIHASKKQRPGRQHEA
jgi:hypothetical protein